MSTSAHPKIPERRVRNSFGRASWPAQRAAWAFEERLVWTGTDAMRGVIDDALWPFERLAWMIRRRAIWPIEDRLRTWNRPAKSALAVALVGAAGAAGVAGAQIATNPAGSGPTALPAPVAKVAPAAPVSVELAPEPAKSPREVLHGAAPTFAPATDSTTTAAADDDSATAATAAAAPVAPPAPVAGAPGEAPREALKVARKFAEAFVLYEVGNQDPTVLDAFRETAAEPLVDALEERPPRQPADVKVPEAKVLNIVAGPRHGDSLEVSASLLRLGDMSELRLHLTKSDSSWLVTDVRG